MTARKQGALAPARRGEKVGGWNPPSAAPRMASWRRWRRPGPFVELRRFGVAFATRRYAASPTAKSATPTRRACPNMVCANQRGESVRRCCCGFVGPSRAIVDSRGPPCQDIRASPPMPRRSSAQRAIEPSLGERSVDGQSSIGRWPIPAPATTRSSGELVTAARN